MSSWLIDYGNWLVCQSEQTQKQETYKRLMNLTQVSSWAAQPSISIHFICVGTTTESAALKSLMASKWWLRMADAETPSSQDRGGAWG